jgi:alkylation response protein AidB-like acyl-CoA dehydrogenase
MELSEKQQKFQNDVRQFCIDEIEPNANLIEKDEKIPKPIFEKIAEFGLFGMVAPREYGGLGLDTVSYAIAVEEASRVCGSTGITLAAHNSLGIMPFVLFGNDKQKEDYIPVIADGMHGLAAFGLTEPEAGSDAGSTKTTAVKKDDKWILNGNKCFITNAGLCHVLIATAKTQKVPGSKGISAFIVDHDTPGFVIGKKEDKMGLRGSDTRELAFENVELPLNKLLGNEGEGFKQFLTILDGGRISIAAMALGLAQGALDNCLKYVKEHSYNGSLRIASQSVQFELADMYTKIQCARHLIYYSARLEDAHKKFATESAMAKLYASEIATEVAAKAIELVGSDGYTDNSPLGRIFRDVRLCEVGEGTSEIQRLVIARSLMK